MSLPALGETPAATAPWYKELSRWHWSVLIIAWLGWIFDTMDQRIFILARQPAITSLLPAGTSPENVKWFGGVATAVFMVGWASGGVYFGIMADRWGRARTMLTTILMYSAFTGFSALSQSWWDFMLYRFGTGLGVGGEFAAGVALIAETMPERARPYALGLLQALTTVGNILGSLLSLVLLPLGWRWLFLAGILPAALVALVFRKMKEPDSWQKLRTSASEAELQKFGAIADLFRDRRWRKNTLIGITLAIAGVVGLWGIGLWTPELIRETLRGIPVREQIRYVTIGTSLQDLGAFFGIYAFTWVTGKIGRRPTFIAGFLLGLGATVMAFGFLRTTADLYWMLPILGFANLSVFGGYAIYFPELYPTRLRSTGVGFCYNAGRIIAAIGPFTLGTLTVTFASAGYRSPFRAAAIAVASVYLIGAAAIPFAAETRGQPLPED